MLFQDFHDRQCHFGIVGIGPRRIGKDALRDALPDLVEWSKKKFTEGITDGQAVEREQRSAECIHRFIPSLLMSPQYSDSAKNPQFDLDSEAFMKIGNSRNRVPAKGDSVVQNIVDEVSSENLRAFVQALS